MKHDTNKKVCQLNHQWIYQDKDSIATKRLSGVYESEEDDYGMYKMYICELDKFV